MNFELDKEMLTKITKANILTLDQIVQSCKKNKKFELTILKEKFMANFSLMQALINLHPILEIKTQKPKPRFNAQILPFKRKPFTQKGDFKSHLSSYIPPSL